MRVFLVFFLFFSIACFADDPFKELNGQFHISGKSVNDAPRNESKDTHMYIRLNGEAAKKMYKMIKSEPIINRCAVNHLSKFSGNIQCDYFEKTEKYSCQFSVDVKNSKIGLGGSC